MPAIGSLVVQSAVDYALDYHVRGPMKLQTIQDKPLLRWLEAGKKVFPGGKANITEPVQGTLMKDTAGFFAGYTGDTALTFTQKALGDRAEYPWKETHAGYVVTFTELAQDGLIVVDGEQRTAQASESDLIRLSGILESGMQDFMESYSMAQNTMYWGDGSQDANQIPGIRALIFDDPTAGTVGGISQSSNTWWRSRASLGRAVSADNQDLTKFLRNEIIQLRRYGGKPNKGVCGSGFWDGLMTELQAKGQYTTEGFSNSKNDLGIDTISLKGLGTFEYDPTLDDLGKQKACYVLDSRATKMRPMDGGHNQTLTPARPYNYMVLLKSLVDKGGLTTDRLSGQGVYTIA